MDVHERRSSRFNDREVDSQHQPAPALEWERGSFNLRLCWLKEAADFSDESETTPKSSLKRPVDSLEHFDLGPGMMCWASLCQASASDRGTLPYEEALPGFRLPGQ